MILHSLREQTQKWYQRAPSCQSKVKLRKALFIHNIKFVKMKLNIPNMHELVKKNKIKLKKNWRERCSF